MTLVSRAAARLLPFPSKELLVALVAALLTLTIGCQPPPIVGARDSDSATSQHGKHVGQSGKSSGAHQGEGHAGGHAHDGEEHKADKGSHGDHDKGHGKGHDKGHGKDQDGKHAAQAASTTASSAVPPAKTSKATKASKSSEPLVMELGSPELTQGIPGKGRLTQKAIKAWLADDKNHQPITVKLPLGLAAAEANITGLEENPMTLAKIELGRQLYFDTRLSRDNSVSCATCHHPDTAYGAHTQFGVGIDGQKGGRNSPVSYNRIVSGPQFWDGRAESLEAQAVGPIENPIEMGHTHEACVECVKSVKGYQMQFKAIFGKNSVTIDNIGKAIATFERTIVTSPAPYDYLEITKSFDKQWGEDLDELESEEPEQFKKYQMAKEQAEKMSESAKRGAELFFAEKSNCTACHAGANFSDEKFHNLGVGMMADKPDLGRFDVTKKEIDKGAFKTPTLRNVALSGPFMHDGSQKTLEEVVDWYGKGGHPNPFLSEKMKKLELSDQDKSDLVAFMREGLTSEFPVVETGRLPK